MEKDICINSKVDFIGLRALNSNFIEKKIPLLTKQLKDWESTKPLANLRILHILVNSYETIIKLEPLLLSGADVTVVGYDLLKLPNQDEIDSKIKELNIKFIENLPDASGEYDYVLDCGARALEIKDLTVLKGIVELTQSGSEKYKTSSLHQNIPIVSIDSCLVKEFEGIYGTGESFVRAIEQLSGKKLEVNSKFFVFGFGKIGRGICINLTKKGVSKDNICIITYSSKRFGEIAELGYSRCFSIENQLTEIKAEIQKGGFCAVTATGAKGFLEKCFDAGDFSNINYLCNMGNEDEFGSEFSSKAKNISVSFAINFLLKQPTLMKFLDPTFYCHNQAIELIEQGATFSKGFNAYPNDECISCLKYWQEEMKDEENITEFLKN